MASPKCFKIRRLKRSESKVKRRLIYQKLTPLKVRFLENKSVLQQVIFLEVLAHNPHTFFTLCHMNQFSKNMVCNTISFIFTMAMLQKYRYGMCFRMSYVFVSILCWFPQFTRYFWRVFRFLFLERNQDSNVISVKNVQGCF
jgi:hypothetical protein